MGIVSTKIGLQVRLPSKNRNTKARQHDTYAEISSLCALATAPTQGVEAFKSLWSGSLQVFVYISLGPIATVVCRGDEGFRHSRKFVHVQDFG